MYHLIEQNGMLHQLWNTIARDLLYVPSDRTEWCAAPAKDLLYVPFYRLLIQMWIFCMYHLTDNCMLYHLWIATARDLLYVPSHRTEWYVAPFVECNSKRSFICTILQTVVCCTSCGVKQQGIFYMYHLTDRMMLLQLWNTKKCYLSNILAVR